MKSWAALIVRISRSREMILSLNLPESDHIHVQFWTLKTVKRKEIQLVVMRMAMELRIFKK